MVAMRPTSDSPGPGPAPDLGGLGHREPRLTRPLTPLDGWGGVRIVEPAVFLAELDALE